MKSRHGADHDLCWAFVAFIVQAARNQFRDYGHVFPGVQQLILSLT